MASKAQGSTVRNVAIAVFVVVLLLLLLFGYGFLAALVFALVLAAAAVAFLLSMGRRGEDPLDFVTAGTVENAGTAPEPRPAAPAARFVEPVPTPSEANANAAPGGIAPTAAAVGAMPPGAVPPPRLDMPRAGNPDDLKRIRGVGPKLEELLHRMGIFHLDQIAAWGPAEVAWMDESLEGFRGRVTRDDWVGQARLLAGGGETEFSRRVDDGEVY